jgi:CBS domain-containing protein
MTTARDIMTPDAECAHADDTLVDAARRMRDLGVGALPVCGPDERLQGMVTDRDIVVKCIAEGGDLTPPTRVQDLAQGAPVTIGADDDVDEALSTMVKHGVRRLPVIDGHALVGMVSQADVAREASPDRAGELLAALSEAGDNN